MIHKFGNMANFLQNITKTFYFNKKELYFIFRGRKESQDINLKKHPESNLHKL